jgi:hypothetical protein
MVRFNPIGQWFMKKESRAVVFAAICSWQMLILLFKVDLHAASLQEYLHEPYETFTELPISETGIQREFTFSWISPALDPPDAAVDSCEWSALWHAHCLLEDTLVAVLLKQQELILSPASRLVSLLRIQNISHKSSSNEDLNRRLLS